MNVQAEGVLGQKVTFSVRSEIDFERVTLRMRTLDPNGPPVSLNLQLEGGFGEVVVARKDQVASRIAEGAVANPCR